MSIYVDEGFRPCVTESATVAFRVCFDERARVFEVSADALIAYFGAASRRRADLLVAFEAGLEDILKVAEHETGVTKPEPIRLDVDEFREVRH